MTTYRSSLPISTKMAAAPEDDGTVGISTWGYTVQLKGQQVLPWRETEGIMELDRNTSYKLRIQNSNDHMCMVRIEVDGVMIGNIYLYWNITVLHSCSKIY